MRRDGDEILTIFETPYTTKWHFRDPLCKNGFFETHIQQNDIFKTPYTTFFLLWPPQCSHTKMAKVLTLPIKKSRIWPYTKIGKSLTTLSKKAKNCYPHTRIFYPSPSPYQQFQPLYNQIAFSRPLYKNGIFESLYSTKWLFRDPYTKMPLSRPPYTTKWHFRDPLYKNVDVCVAWNTFLVFSIMKYTFPYYVTTCSIFERMFRNYTMNMCTSGQFRCKNI